MFSVAAIRPWTSTGHVVLHPLHPLGVLEVEPARVERDALADESDTPLPAARGRVREVDELRRLGAPGGHSEERAHPHPAAFGAVVDLDREPALLGELHGGARSEERRV